MSVTKRLAHYGLFDDELVGRVAEVAERQARLDYRDFLAEQGVPEPFTIRTSSGKLASIVDIVPSIDYDSQRARVMHAPHGNPLDTNTLYQAATVFAVDPTVRLIVTGNPSSRRYPGNHLTSDERKKVSQGDVTPTILPVFDYMDMQGVAMSDQIGYSWGAKKATAATLHAPVAGQTVGHMVHIEPVHLEDRSLLALGADFKASDAAKLTYFETSDCPALMQALNDGIGALDFYTGILSPSGIAIARSMRHGTYESEVRQALQEQPHLKVFAAAGGASELVPVDAFEDAMQRLQGEFNEYGNHRVRGAVLPKERHALANDIYLQAALAHHGLQS